MKILVVDDSITIRSYITQLLEAESYQVIQGEDGNIGVQKFKENHDLDLVISDLNMPNKNGIEMIAEIRKYNQDIPILMCTTESEEGLKKQGAQAGANGWVVKTYSGKAIHRHSQTNNRNIITTE